MMNNHKIYLLYEYSRSEGEYCIAAFKDKNQAEHHQKFLHDYTAEINERAKKCERCDVFSDNCKNSCKELDEYGECKNLRLHCDYSYSIREINYIDSYVDPKEYFKSIGFI